MVSALVGAGAALSAERRYTYRTLPDGVRRGIDDFVHRGDLTGLARATTIVAGLTATTVGYGIRLLDDSAGGATAGLVRRVAREIVQDGTAPAAATVQ